MNLSRKHEQTFSLYTQTFKYKDFRKHSNMCKHAHGPITDPRQTNTMTRQTLDMINKDITNAWYASCLFCLRFVVSSTFMSRVFSSNHIHSYMLKHILIFQPEA